MPPQYQQSASSSSMARPPSPSTPVSGAGRPQFRRQGSSYGPGQVHHMAVMVAPNRVDYSVGKGGLRSWAVLIVFVLLCSALLNIFSEEPEGIDDDLAAQEETLVDSQTQEDMARPRVEQKRQILLEDGKGGEEGEEEGDEEEEQEKTETEAQPLVDTGDVEDEDDDEEDDEEDDDEEDEEKMEQSRQKDLNLEELMLARLRRATKRWRAAGPAKVTRQRIRKRDRDEEEEEKEEEGEEGEEGEVENEVERDQEPEDAGEEIVENGDAEENARAEEAPTVASRKTQKKQQQQTAKQLETAEEHEEDEQMEKDGELLLKSHKADRPKRVQSWRQLQSPKDEGQRPRNTLLIRRHKPILPKSSGDGDAKGHGKEEEEEDDCEADANMPEAVPTGEIIALRKRQGYNRKAITSRGDYRHRQMLDSADYLLEQHEFAAAEKKYQQVLTRDSESPRALFGIARLAQLRSEFAEEEGEPKSGQLQQQLLEKAMATLERVLGREETPDELFRIAAQHFVECARFRGGQQHKIVQTQRKLIDRFPDDLTIQCQFGATWLGMNRPEEAAAVFKNVLDAEPNHPLAQAYYGYTLKLHLGELEKGVQLLRKAIRSAKPEVTGDPKFYFHLGDGLTRLGRLQEAYSVYADAVENGLLRSVFQRSLHNMAGLVAQPWWSMDHMECAKQLRQLERHWTAIKEEAMHIWAKRPHSFLRESSHLVDPSAGGHWILPIRGDGFGDFRPEVCDRWMPSTCELLKQFTDSICAREKIKLFILQPGTNSWPHCGLTNYVIEAHLGLVAPSEARLRVGREIKGWRPGKLFVFDTSFEREITFEGAPANALMVALVLELWHPQVPQTLRGKIGSDQHQQAVEED